MSDTNNMNNLLAPVFLELGKAIYICQCFESSLCFLLSTMEHESANGEDGVFQAAWNFHSKNTLGRLLKSLREQIDVPEDLVENLRTGIDKRNEIVHGYLERNAVRLYDPTGRLGNLRDRPLIISQPTPKALSTCLAAHSTFQSVIEISHA